MRFPNRMGLVLAASAALLASGAARAATAPDPWITAKVKIALLSTDGVHATDVNVDTNDGRVTLHGVVPNAQEKARAEDVAKSVDGVREVRNLVQVVPAKAEKATRVADGELEKRIQETLQKDPALQDSKIELRSVNDGVVLLGGSAKTVGDELRAIEETARTPGVRHVASEIKGPDTLADREIWREGRPDDLAPAESDMRDAWITTAAKLRLLANPATPALDVNVDTQDSVVTVFGSVASVEQRRAVESEVKKVDGVKAVRNELQVVPELQRDAVVKKDAEIRDAIEKQIEARDLEDADVDVAVSDGVARLTGSVKSQADRLVVLTTARGVPGVRSVIGDLRVESTERPAVSAR
ncbi:MAG TPA: BON domain-containing protein [Myxococcota bacterium]|nr:BON domain-containing protein [Myxococcota bacterium]